MPGRPLADAVGLWPMNSLGNKAFDLSGNNNSGTFINETFWEPTQKGPGIGADGVDDSISFSWSKLGIAGYPFSVVWAATHHTINNHTNYVSFSDASFIRNCFFVGIDNSNRLMADVFDFSGGYHSARVTGIAEGQKVNGAAVFRSNSDRRAYLDGANENINVGVDDLVFANLDSFNLFRWVNSNPDVWTRAKEYEYLYICNRILFVAEIDQIYREPFCMFPENIMPEFGISA